MPTSLPKPGPKAQKLWGHASPGPGPHPPCMGCDSGGDSFPNAPDCPRLTETASLFKKRSCLLRTPELAVVGQNKQLEATGADPEVKGAAPAQGRT